jgi:hypothetical protein
VITNIILAGLLVLNFFLERMAKALSQVLLRDRMEKKLYKSNYRHRKPAPHRLETTPTVILNFS